MKFIHHVTVNLSGMPEARAGLLALGFDLPESFAAFDVDENDERWPKLVKLVKKWDFGDYVRTKFTKKEIADAHWLQLVPDWHHGYPQPDDDVFGYRDATYDLANWCERCGIGMKQKAPFQMKGEPKWGKRSILQLNWVFDEYFVTPEAWADVFKSHRVECRPVMNTKGVELKTVVQLVTNAEVGIVSDGLPMEEPVCLKCGRTKYLPVARGRYPALRTAPSFAMVKTKEYFGSGASADNGVLVSQALAQTMTAAKVRGVSFRPVDEGKPRGSTAI